MDDRIPLTSEDIAILELESDTVAGHTCKLIRIAAPGLALGELRKAVGERMEDVPELTRRLDDDPAHPAWVPDPGFRLSHHLGLYANGHAVSEPELREVTAQIFTEKLDRTYPLWRIEMVNLEDGGTALIWRIHHVLADGTTAMRMARQLLWDEGHDELTAGRQISGRAKAGRPAKPATLRSANTSGGGGTSSAFSSGNSCAIRNRRPSTGRSATDARSPSRPFRCRASTTLPGRRRGRP